MLNKIELKYFLNVLLHVNMICMMGMFIQECVDVLICVYMLLMSTEMCNVNNL